jgi:hypothetical protein
VTVGEVRVFSHGGGWQSTACLVLAAQGRIDYRTFLFANVGEDSENPDTLAYFHEIAKPFAAKHGLELIELRRHMRDGSTRTLMEEIEQFPRSLPIPVRLQGGGFGTRRCTERFKIAVVGKWTREHGATEDNPATVGVGFSIDEADRASTRQPIAWERRHFPLFDLRLSKTDCARIIVNAGLPMPSKSSCWFCPFKGLEDWRRLAREEPETFAKAVALEEMLAERHERLRGDKVWLSPLMRPLSGVLNQGALFDEQVTCDAGSCLT